MRFLMLIHVAEDGDESPPPDTLIQAVEGLRADTTLGTIVDDGGLTPVADSIRVRTDAGAVTVVDGPFAEAKEVVGGFFLVESASAADMAEWTRQFVELHATHWPSLSYLAEVRQVVGPNG